jgi:predicted secreted protein
MPFDLLPGAVRGSAALSVLALAIASLLLAMTGRWGHAQDAPAGPDPDDSDAPITASAGEQFVVALDSNATTGYTWQLDDPGDTSVVQLVGSEYVAPGAQAPGAGGKELWTFEAAAPGTTTLVLSYRRPFDPPTIPAARTKQIVVIVS